MPIVKFLQDFQGKETKEVFYKQGQEVDLPDYQLERLLADRRVELVAGNRFAVEPQFEQAEEPHYGAQAEPELRNDEAIYEQVKPKSKRGRK